MKSNEMELNNNNGFDAANGNGRQRRDRGLQTKRSVRLKHTSDKHNRECGGSYMSGGDKE